jgi:thiamine-phosphate pyrophosphorylase
MKALNINTGITAPIRPKFPIGLYGITPDWHDIEKLDDAIHAAAAGGMQVVQLRLKTVEPGTRLAFAERLMQTCHRLGVLFILNDDWRMVQVLSNKESDKESNKESDRENNDQSNDQSNGPNLNGQLPIGAHIGRDDGNSQIVRAALGHNVVLGVSCYDDLNRAIAATQPIPKQSVHSVGINAPTDLMSPTVDYVAFGAMFTSQTKPGAPAAALTTLTQARQHWQHLANRPAIVAIGGITLSNVAQVVRAGADSIAVSGSLFLSPTIEHTARQFSDCIHEQTNAKLNGIPTHDKN